MSRTSCALARVACLLILLVGIPNHRAYASSPAHIDPVITGSVQTDSMLVLQGLEAILERIPPISPETKIRRDIAQATFCLPQNILGTLFYGLLQMSGTVVTTAEMNEMTIIVTRTPFGASLGRYIFLGEDLQTEYTVRHEYGHTMQGYKHGPFFLLFEGLVSFVQATVSIISPSFAAGYFDRWPENEANELAGIERGNP